MSFTVQEARAAFFNVASIEPYARITLAAQKFRARFACPNSEVPNVLTLKCVGDARDLTSVQVYRVKENTNVTKEIPQRINQAWR
jgi:hypothetical protein